MDVKKFLKARSREGEKHLEGLQRTVPRAPAEMGMVSVSTNCTENCINSWIISTVFSHSLVAKLVTPNEVEV